MTTIGTSTNTPTCPDWCELEQHHDYDSITNDGRLLRHHATKARVTVELLTRVSRQLRKALDHP